MITFQDDGSIVIDFPSGPITVSAPTFGGMKRLRAERSRLGRVASEAALQWEREHPAPDGDDPDITVALARHAEDRILAAEQANLQGSADWWRLVLVGSDDFKRLTDDQVPEDTDDWPADLLYDFRPIPPTGATIDQLMAAQPLVDQVFRWWGKGRSRSGSTNGATATNQASPVL